MEINPRCPPDTNVPLGSFSSRFHPRGCSEAPTTGEGGCPSILPPSQQAWKAHHVPVLQPVTGWERAPSQDHAGQGHGLAWQHTDHGGCKSYFWGCSKEGKGNQY